jgi:hypothetical protein
MMLLTVSLALLAMLGPLVLLARRECSKGAALFVFGFALATLLAYGARGYEVVQSERERLTSQDVTAVSPGRLSALSERLQKLENHLRLCEQGAPAAPESNTKQ